MGRGEESIGGLYIVNIGQDKEDMLKLEDSQSNSVSNASRASAIAAQELKQVNQESSLKEDRLNLNES